MKQRVFLSVVCLALLVCGASSQQVTQNYIEALVELILTGAEAVSLSGQTLDNRTLISILNNISKNGTDLSYGLLYQAIMNRIENLYSNNLVNVTSCGVGSYINATNGVCTPCPAGYWSETVLASSFSACQPCAAGTYSGVVGAGNRTTCTPCAEGTFSAVVAASSVSVCQTCTAGATSVAGAQGANGCQCIAGYYQSGAACVPCVAGFFCSGGVSQACPGQAEGISTSPAMSSRIEQCQCVAGYYGFAYLAVTGGCQLCPQNSYCTGEQSENNYGQIYPCAQNSESPAGSTMIDQCVCKSSYRKQYAAQAQRTYTVTATPCVCTNARSPRTCSVVDVAGCTTCPDATRQPASYVCDRNGQIFTCKQGYIGLSPPNTPPLSNGYVPIVFSGTPYSWKIAPVDAEYVTVNFLKFNSGSLNNILTIVSCTNVNCSYTASVATLSDDKTNMIQNGGLRFTSIKGMPVLWLRWTSTSATTSPFFLEYTSTISCDKSAIALTAGLVSYPSTGVIVQYPYQPAFNWPLVVWLGDQVSFLPNTVTLDLRSGSPTGASEVPYGFGVTVWEPSASGNYWLVDTEFPSRTRQVYVAPVDSRRVMVWYDVPGTSFVLSGDVSGSGSPDIVLVVRDVLSLSRLTATDGVVIYSQYTNRTVNTPLSGPDLAGQGVVGSAVFETSLTWDTKSYSSGVYYYGSVSNAGSVVVGKIILYPASGGVSCAACRQDEYCYNGTTAKCPLNSVSQPGSTQASDCKCVAGYARSTTDLEKYVNSQAVDCGGRHSCVVAQNGSLWCWGANDGGQLGIGSAGSSQATPRIVPGLSGVTQVALGDNFTCAVYLSGSENRVKCWGNNRWGQLGLDSNVDQQFSPGLDARLGIGTAVYSTVALACAGSSCCAVVSRTGGKALTCWGKNDLGQLGVTTYNGFSAMKNIGTGTSSFVSTHERYSYAATGTALSVGSREVALVTMAVEHACALDTDGYVFCWGLQRYGSLGTIRGGVYLELSFPMDPSQVVDLGGGAAKTVNCYAYVCCVVMQRTFEVKCWGRGLGGRLGVGVFDVGTTVSSMGLNLQSVDLGVNTLVMDVNVGSAQTCVLLSNNYVKCWGRVLGADIGDNPPADMMDMLPNFDLAGGKVALQIAGKGLTTCAITSDYSVVCWGDNTNRQLGAVANVTASNMTLVAMPTGVTALRSSGTPQGTVCTMCEADTYCDGSGGLPVSCPANTNSPQRSQSLDSCKCVPGYKEVVSGSSKTCALCTGVEYCLLGLVYNCDQFSSTVSPGSSDKSACQCSVGYYLHATLGCQPCAQGLYKDAVGNNGSCSACPAGTRSNATAVGNVSGCLRCEPGTVSSAGSTVCSKCGQGTAAPAGSSSCAGCGAGFFSDEGAGACTPCRAGTYDGEPRNGLPDTCATCPPGTASAALNATQSSACGYCRAGTFSDVGAANCSLCAPGQYSAEGSASCTSCPGNSTSVAGSNYSQCKCLAGFYKRFEPDGTTFTCQPCRGGEFAGFDKVGACSQCPGGTASTVLQAVNSSVCSTCLAGTFAAAGSSACQSCAPTTFSGSNGASVCVSCDLGFWSGLGASVCTGCGPGYYADAPITSAAQCLLCPRGSICVGAANAKTQGVALRQECPLGTFQNITGRTLMSQCSPCDANSFCPGPTLKAACPTGTKSNVSSTSQLQCFCEVGYTCNYRKVLNALVTLLMSKQQWEDNPDVQKKFLEAVATAAKTTTGNVRIVSVTQVGAAGGSRRLFGVAGSHVLMEILDGEGLGIDTELDGLLGASGLEIDAERAWIAPHRVDAVRLPADA